MMLSSTPFVRWTVPQSRCASEPPRLRVPKSVPSVSRTTAGVAAATSKLMMGGMMTTVDDMCIVVSALQKSVDPRP